MTPRWLAVSSAAPALASKGTTGGSSNRALDSEPLRTALRWNAAFL